MDSIYELQAEILKTLANPRRLEMAHLLADEPMTVGRLAERMAVAQPNVSQHLAVMRAAGVVLAERDGREVRYGLSDPDIIAACRLMRAALQRRLARLAELSARPAGVPSPAIAGHR
ncbi:MAG TPA: metalloregulator ArsR/SmtB family transcription factor [Methylomirabilota bacterium]|jgi:ArsR family transcriptional regulator|nr:metalloregulator ArsR/SmtB family transcription factor [Methylomirabilota bacterium]